MVVCCLPRPCHDVAMHILRNNKIEEAGPGTRTDYEFLSPTQFWSQNVNFIPLVSGVQSARSFYANRFYGQTQPLKDGQAPLVQNLDDADPEGRSFDEQAGEKMGAVKSKHGGVVKAVEPNRIVVASDKDGEQEYRIHHTLPFNRKSGLHHEPLVKPGDRVEPGHVMAKSNYTDKNGVMAIGRNARVALVPFHGKSMDDAVVISEKFAKDLTSDHMETHEQEFDDNVKGGMNHFISLFPKKYTRDQLSVLDPETGVARKGAILRRGDPMFLATRPRSFSSATSSLGNLSRSVRITRSDASTAWDYDEPAEVVDSVKTRDGHKLVTRAYLPVKTGDKIVFRSGQKGVVSEIVPQDRVPRTKDGRPVDVMLNQLSIPSRVNAALTPELLLGKVAEKRGDVVKIPPFNKPGESWAALTRKELASHGLSEEEELYDPALGRNLDRPVTVGVGHVMKLHHISSSKTSARGQASYDRFHQPSKGSGEGAQAKRLSGLESAALLSSGAYANLREAATLRGTASDEWWRALREGGAPKPPGKPFAWHAYLAMLRGTGLEVSDKGKGVLRLGPMTDSHTDVLNPIEVKHGGMVGLRTMEPEKGGLFDPSLVGANRWGVIPLPRPVPNPAYEASVRQLLGLTKPQMEDVLSGTRSLSEVKAKPAKRRPGESVEVQ